MTIAISIPTSLRHECSGQSTLATNDGTVREILAWIEAHHPMLYRSVCDETGAVRRHVNLFVNDDLLHKHASIDVQLSSGDTLTIMPAVSGG